MKKINFKLNNFIYIYYLVLTQFVIFQLFGFSVIYLIKVFGESGAEHPSFNFNLLFSEQEYIYILVETRY